MEFDPSKRAGLLTQPAVLALGAYAVNPAPILRGTMLLERLACETMGTPPPGAEEQFLLILKRKVPIDSASKPNVGPSVQAVTRRLTHLVLHLSITMRLGSGALPTTVNPSMHLVAFVCEAGSIEFGDAIELGEKLAQSHQILDCHVRRWADYASGYTLSDDNVELQQLQMNFRESDEILNSW